MDNKKRIRFISNPISGTKDKELIYKNIESLLNKDLYIYEICETEYAGHAAELAKAAVKEGIDIVVAIGGDGTVNEVASSVIHTHTALGIIPCGSGNGLARHLDIPMDSKKAIQILNEGEIHLLDYGKINGKPFFCTCGVGFDAYVSFKFAEAGKRGLLTYLEKTLNEGLRYKPETYFIEDETGEKKFKAFLIACANASQYGNNAYIAPQASMKDGLMDITIMEPFNALEAPQIALQLFSKTLNHNSHIKMFRTRKITIHRQKESIIHCDGDPIMMGKDIEVEIINKDLYIVVNPEHTEKRKSQNILQILSDYFDDFSLIPNDLRRSNRGLQVLNKYMLRRLRKK